MIEPFFDVPSPPFSSTPPKAPTRSIGLDATESLFVMADRFGYPPEERPDAVGEILTDEDGTGLGIVVAMWRSPEGLDVFELDPARHPADVDGWEHVA